MGRHAAHAPLDRWVHLGLRGRGHHPGKYLRVDACMLAAAAPPRRRSCPSRPRPSAAAALRPCAGPVQVPSGIGWGACLCMPKAVDFTSIKHARPPPRAPVSGLAGLAWSSYVVWRRHCRLALPPLGARGGAGASRSGARLRTRHRGPSTARLCGRASRITAGAYSRCGRRQGGLRGCWVLACCWPRA